ncbi:MAG TPA: LysM peptidoglycan-binding domain-containing protein, partial [Thiobacillaceae bacterium]
SWEIYHPRRGERLGTIAKKFRFSIAELKRVNGIPARSWKVPRVLVVPMLPDEGKTAMKLAAAPAKGSPSEGSGKVHIVKPGDTLSSIGALHRVSVEALRKWNGVSDLLQIGQKIHIRTGVR